MDELIAVQDSYTHIPPSHNDFKLFFLFSFINLNSLFMKQVMAEYRKTVK